MAKEVWERKAEGYVPGGGRQPNFLQKLYDFLALDPHPCPEVIYWASDSRQLVIAQPDRLVKEVLPRLFKHGKLSSFGRQLNIYGFSRLFPGRQFKDANGNVSDASVWAHPTLHRLSTPLELSTIKRRAAPKLFRTRRLANGQIIRSRAGPAVEAKFREVRENIAESRRQRGLGVDVEHGSSSGDGSWDQGNWESGGGSGSGQSGPGKRLEDIEEEVEANDVSPPWLESGLELGLGSEFGSGFGDWGRRASMLSTTTAGSGSDWSADWAGTLGPSMMSGNEVEFPYFPPEYPHPLPTQPDLLGSDDRYSGNSAYISPQAPPPQVQPQPQAQVLTHRHVPLAPLDRLYQSCPASLHTSPIPSRAQLVDSWNYFNQAYPPMPSTQVVPRKGGHPMYPSKITAPAAQNPFETQAQNQAYRTGQTVSLSQGTVSDPPTRFVSTTATPYPEPGQLDLNLNPNPSWEGLPRTIDPRCVSPNSSMWTTPAVTPRARSPVPQFHVQAQGQGQDYEQGQGHYPGYTQSFAQSSGMGIGTGLGTQSYPPRVVDRRGLVSPDDSVDLAFGEGGVSSEGMRLSGGLSI